MIQPLKDKGWIPCCQSNRSLFGVVRLGMLGDDHQG
jgi:hypothetical protein